MGINVPIADENVSVQAIDPKNIQTTFSSCIDLVSAPLGGRIISLSDEYFAPASNLLNPSPPIRKPGHYVHTGAWYDGWETRRHNLSPCDWVVIKLGVDSGIPRGVEIDTAFFNGNHAPAVAVEACLYHAPGNEFADPSKDETVKWDLILPQQECGPSQQHAWLLSPTKKAYSHVRLLMFPDGGMARFRLYGKVVPVFPHDPTAVIDLASLHHGGRAVAYSDQHFGTASNLLLPGRGVDMGDGWETKRSRGKDHTDWVIVRLGARGRIRKVVVDTAHFRGNYPQAVEIKACDFSGEGEPGHDYEGWVEVAGRQKCVADFEHGFSDDMLKGAEGKAWTHVMMVIVPDGGVKRLRIFGTRVA